MIKNVAKAHLGMSITIPSTEVDGNKFAEKLILLPFTSVNGLWNVVVKRVLTPLIQ